VYRVFGQTETRYTCKFTYMMCEEEDRVWGGFLSGGELRTFNSKSKFWAIFGFLLNNMYRVL
jgi:hypothetical protein